MTRRFFATPGAGQELTSWIQHIEGWTDRQIHDEIRTLRAQIAHTPTQRARAIEDLKFALDRLVDLQRRRKTEHRTSRASWLAKLGPRAVRQIRRLYGTQGWSQERLAKRFRVSQSSIHNLLAGKTYKNIM